MYNKLFYDTLDKNVSPCVSLTDELRGRILKYKISHVAVNELLTLINKDNCKSCFPNLPSDSRTFLNTHTCRSYSKYQS